MDKNTGAKRFAAWIDATPPTPSEFADCKKNAARYEKVRRMNPQQFYRVWLDNVATGKNFDDLIDNFTG